MNYRSPQDRFPWPLFFALVLAVGVFIGLPRYWGPRPVEVMFDGKREPERESSPALSPTPQPSLPPTTVENAPSEPTGTSDRPDRSETPTSTERIRERRTPPEESMSPGDAATNRR